MRESLIDSILGCIVGGAIGDAAGAAFEGTHGLPAATVRHAEDWRLTDDTQLTLATCEALTERRSADPEAIAACFLRWFRARRLTGLGASTLKALRDLDVGAHWALAGRKGDRAAGNGAAMRIAPLAFCVDPHSEESRRLIRDICRITHHNDEAYIGALAVMLAIQGARDRTTSLASIASCLPHTSVQERLLAYAALPTNESLVAAAKRYGSSGYVAESVPFALLAAQRVGTLGFEGMLEQVIAAGGDTDTNASLAGQVAGTALGLGGLPPELVELLPQREFVLGVAQAFAEWAVGGG
jgi:ADP-ribosyl-[dinitrogen reductase] hydrolase